MKTPLFFTFISFVFLVGQAQNTENGYVFPVEGTIKAFIVFAEIDYSNLCPDDDNGNIYTDPGGWETWPSDPASTLPPAWADQLFDHEFSSFSAIQGDITRLLYQASFGKLIFLADYYSRVVKVPCSFVPPDATMNSDESVDAALTNLELKIGTTGWPAYTAHTFAFSAFDNYDLRDDSYPANSFYGFPKINSADDYFDMVIVIWRNNRFVNSTNAKCNEGFGVHWTDNHAQIFQDLSGYNASSAFNACGLQGAYSVIMAELSHAFYGGNNWHTSGGADLWTFMGQQRMYYTTAQYDNVSNSFCGFDRFHLGWFHPDNSLDTISALSNAGTLKVSDLQQPATATEDTFILRDFYEAGDAIRIKLPFINWAADGDVKNQYLWIENRQKISEFDVNQFGDGGCKEPLSKT
jgi:hypothetical protein